MRPATRAGLARALSQSDFAAFQSLLRSDAAFRLDTQGSAEILGATIRSIGLKAEVGFPTPWKQAEAALMSQRHWFDAVVRAGAAPNWSQSRGNGIPPAQAAAALPHPCYLELILELGADPNYATASGLTPAGVVRRWRDKLPPDIRDRAMPYLRLLRRFGARDVDPDMFR